MKRVVGFAAAVAAAVAGAWLLARGGRPPPPPSVIVVTIDTMRADAVGPDKGTPALAAFLKTARDFRAARAPVPLTLPSHLSLFSGLLPARHRVHDNAAPAVPKDRGYPLLAEEFRARGYATAAFVASTVVAKHTGLAAGFDVYDDVAPRTDAAGAETSITAEARLPAALEWLEANRDRPFFLWVHFYDPHRPYRPFAGDPRRPPAPPEASEAERYAGEVRRVDAAMESLLAAVPAGAIVVVASDHGESLGEHGESSHGALCYSATLDVFLAVRGPGMEPGSVDSGARSLCSVAPTLRAWCGLPPKPADAGPLFGPPERAVLSESLLAWRHHGWGQCFAVWDGRHTLVESGPRVEIFDRSRDRAETSPQPAAGHAAYESLDTALTAMRSTATAPGAPEYIPDVVSPYGSARQPRSYYLSRAENARLPDPVLKVPEFDEMERIGERIGEAVHARDRDGIFAILRRLEDLAAADPENPAPHYLMAEAYRGLAAVTRTRNWHRSAAGAAREALERGYAVPAVVIRILEQSRLAGTPEDWRAGLESAAAADFVPDLACAREAFELALQLAAAGDAGARDLALDLLERTERSFPDAETRRRLDEMRAALR